MSQEGDIIHATIWCPEHGFNPSVGPCCEEPDDPVEDPRRQGFGHFDKIARETKERKT